MHTRIAFRVGGGDQNNYTNVRCAASRGRRESASVERRNQAAVTKTTCLSFAVLACGLMAGTTLAFALLGSPADFSYPTFVEYFQAMVRSVRVPLVVLGVSGLALLAASTFLTWRERPRPYFVGAALLRY